MAQVLALVTTAAQLLSLTTCDSKSQTWRFQSLASSCRASSEALLPALQRSSATPVVGPRGLHSCKRSLNYAFFGKGQ
jgi:hypothetical protein